MTTATAQRVVRATIGIVERGRVSEPNGLRYYPGEDRLEYRPDSKVPVPVLLWVKRLMSERVRSGFCKWGDTRYKFETE